MWKFIDIAIDVDIVYYQTIIFFKDLSTFKSSCSMAQIFFMILVSLLCTYQNVFVQNVLIAEDDGSNYRILLKVPTRASIG